MTKSRIPTHCEIKAGNFGLTKDSVVLAEQIRTLDKSRIIKRVGKVDELTALKIEKAMKISTARKLEKKTELEKLPKETKEYIINKIKFIERAKESIEFYRFIKADNYSISFAEDEKFREENALQSYCDYNDIDYKKIYEDYLKLIRKENEFVAI
jgi:hypothetical protein